MEDILEVSREDTFDELSREDTSDDESPVVSRPVDDSAYLSSSSDGVDHDDDDDDDDDHSDEENSRSSRPDGDSEDDDDSEDEDGLRKSTSFTPSEFDKALSRSRGKPSQGYATSFFANSQDEGDEEDYAPEGDTTKWHGNTNPSDRNNSNLNITTKTARLDFPPSPPSTTSTATTNNSALKKNHSSSSVSNTVLSSSGTNPPRSSGNALTTPRNQSNEQQESLSSGVLPDVLMNMRQKIESLTLFDSDMMRLDDDYDDQDPILVETRESLKRSSQQSISAAVLVSLAHKRYERRRLAAMEIEKVVRSLVQQGEDQLERVRAILLLLSDDYVRSTSEDARKGGVVALAACAIGLKKAPDSQAVHECRDLILASVVHACQDHSQRVRYYATESLFNVVKVIPSLAVQHFFILFEILRSLYADVDLDVRSGAELLDKKLKELIVGAMNSGSFTADACVPVFARFCYMRNKATKRLTLTWLQELNEKILGAPILEFLHLFLGGIFDMVADPTLAIRQSALAFLQSVLPKLLVVNSGEAAIEDMESGGMTVDFDKILQSLTLTMEHADPFVRKVAMYWMSRIVKAHMVDTNTTRTTRSEDGEGENEEHKRAQSAATISVRNSLPHMLPGILLSIGDTFHTKSTTKDSFLPDQTTHALAEQTNACLQDAVRRDGKGYVQHLDGFIVALREELDSSGGVTSKNSPAVERKPYRLDVKHDGTGIESQGWFRTSKDTKEVDVDSMMMSRLCALHWVIVLYESVVPDVLKADYAREFIIPIIHQLVHNPSEQIIFKSLQVLAKITVPVDGESDFSRQYPPSLLAGITSADEDPLFPMTEYNVAYSLDIMINSRRQLKSRDREVFSALIQLYSYNYHLLGDLSRVITFMCRLQPPEFVFISFAVELERFIRRRSKLQDTEELDQPFSRDLEFVSSFVQQMCHVLLNAKEAKELRDVIKDCIGQQTESERDRRRARLFHILLHSFSHNLVATTALCMWGGAYRTASLFLRCIDPLDIHLMFLLELDKLVEIIERPLFRHLHVRMLECDKNPIAEGSGTMLFQTLKSLLMLIPQSTCYNVLRDRLVSTSRFRQSVIAVRSADDGTILSKETEMFVNRVIEVRALHCNAMWETIRADSLESTLAESKQEDLSGHEEGEGRREWLGYSSKEEERVAQARHREEKRRRQNDFAIEEDGNNYNDLESMTAEGPEPNKFFPNVETDESWKDYWAQASS